MEWAVGFAASFLISGAAFWKKSLSLSGMLAAILLGTVMYALGSAAWFGTLIVFFISSTLLSHWKRKAKAEAEGGYEKSGRRDAGQVLANGGAAALLCAAHAIWPHALLWWAFVGVMATVNADTWATEIGGFSRTPPRSICGGRRVAPGTSGGVTALGLAAAAGGAAFIGAAAGAFAWASGRPAAGGFGPGLAAAAGAPAEPLLAPLAGLLLVALASGFAGALADSWLGATWQAMHRCAVCGKEVERTAHCGSKTVPLRGIRCLNNDAVNALSSLLGGSLAVVLGLLLS